jgi:hypothetical protein
MSDLPESVKTIHLTVDGIPWGSMSREEYDYSTQRAELVHEIIQRDLERAYADAKRAGQDFLDQHAEVLGEK